MNKKTFILLIIIIITFFSSAVKAADVSITSESVEQPVVVKENTGKADKPGRWFYDHKKIKGKKVRVKRAYRFEDGTYPVGAAKIGDKYYYFTKSSGMLYKSTKKTAYLNFGRVEIRCGFGRNSQKGMAGCKRQAVLVWRNLS